MAAGPVNGSCTRLGSVAGDYGCRTDARFIEKHAPISLMSLPSRAPENEFFHNDFQSSAGLGRGCNPARGCSRRGVASRGATTSISSPDEGYQGRNAPRCVLYPKGFGVVESSNPLCTHPQYLSTSPHD